MTIPDIARAYHCPPYYAREVMLGKTPAYRMIHRLGPIRVWWKRAVNEFQHVGWMLDNRPATLNDIVNERWKLGVRKA